MIVYVAAINLVYFFLMVLGFFVIRRDRGRPTRPERDALMKSPLVPTVSIIAPAHNEEATIRESVRSFLSLEYPSLSVIVVNDGSTDDTLKVLIEEFRLYRSSRRPGGRQMSCRANRSMRSTNRVIRSHWSSSTSKTVARPIR